MRLNQRMVRSEKQNKYIIHTHAHTKNTHEFHKVFTDSEDNDFLVQFKSKRER